MAVFDSNTTSSLNLSQNLERKTSTLRPEDLESLRIKRSNDSDATGMDTNIRGNIALVIDVDAKSEDDNKDNDDNGGDNDDVESRSDADKNENNNGTKSMPKGSSSESVSNVHHRCFTCSAPILRHEAANMVKINTLRFHDDCCVCSCCMQQLDGEIFCENDATFCKKCYAKMFDFDCSSCRLPIISGVKIVYMDNFYHKKCFKCHTCDKNLVESSNSKSIYQNRLYCNKCHDLAIKTDDMKYCDLCHLPIFTQPMATNDRFNGKPLRIHAHHLRCDICESKLSSYSAKHSASRSVCGDCIENERHRPCHACGKLAGFRLIRFQSKVYHHECFVCCKCGCKVVMNSSSSSSSRNNATTASAGSGNVLSRNGLPICWVCHRLHRNIRCSGCKMSNCEAGSKVAIFEKIWAEQHTFCHRCDTFIKPKKGLVYTTLDLNMYCKSCLKKYNHLRHYSY